MCFYDYLSNFGCGVGVFVVVFLVWLRGYFNIFVVVFLRYFFCDLNSFFGNCNIKYLKFWYNNFNIIIIFFLDFFE